MWLMRVSWSTARVAGKDRVELGRRVVDRARPLVALVGLIGRRGGDQRQRAVLQRLLERRERRIDIVRPAIGIVVAQREVVVARAPHVVDRRVVLGREIDGVGHDAKVRPARLRSQFGAQVTISRASPSFCAASGGNNETTDPPRRRWQARWPLAVPARAEDRPLRIVRRLSAGRRHRHHRPAGGRQDARLARPPGDRREQAGRGGHDRQLRPSRRRRPTATRC